MSAAVDSIACRPLDWHAPGQVLSRDQKEFYDKNGFVIVKNVVPKHLLDRYARRFKEVCQRMEVPPNMTVMRDVAIAKSEFIDGERAVNKLQDFQDDPMLFDYCRLPQILSIVEDLIGKGSIMAMHTMLINKPPDPGTLTSRHPMHQDLHYFPFRPADRVCCSWTAMERVHRDNGCLVVVPGSHKGPLLAHDYPKWEGGVNKLYHGIVGYDPETHDRVHVVMEAGDTVFFHPMIIHGSGANRTNGFRKAISCHYANGSASHYIDVKGTTQEMAEDELRELAKKKLGSNDIELNMGDVWQFKARPVRGTRANL